MKYIPCVPVLISHFLLHLSISEHLNCGSPLLCISQLTYRKLDSRQCLTKTILCHCNNQNWRTTIGCSKPECIGAGMPAQLSTDGVGNGCSKLPSKSKISTELPGKELRAVERIGEIPLKLVNQWNIPNVDVQLYYMCALKREVVNLPSLLLLKNMHTFKELFIVGLLFSTKFKPQATLTIVFAHVCSYCAAPGAVTSYYSGCSFYSAPINSYLLHNNWPSHYALILVSMQSVIGHL